MTGPEANDRFAPPRWDPPADPIALRRVVEALERAGQRVTRNHPLGALTTLGVGGTAAAYVLLADMPAAYALAGALAATTTDEVPVFVLGKGSNTLVSDDGFPGLVVRLGPGFTWIRREGDDVAAGAGAAMPALATWCAREGLVGLEFAAGIPATVGGSVRMNAGAHGGQTGSLLRKVAVVRPGDRVETSLEPSSLEFAYRTSALPPRTLIVGARWSLTPGDPAIIRRRLEEVRAWRRATQPLRERNCGSVFTNPPDVSAGELIDRAGGKGLRVGGATVSRKHANFVTVGPTASARDVYELIVELRRRVCAAGGPLLHPEVRLVGPFGPPAA